MYDTGYSSIFNDLIGSENLAQFIYNIRKHWKKQKKKNIIIEYYRFLKIIRSCDAKNE